LFVYRYQGLISLRHFQFHTPNNKTDSK